MNHPQLIKIIGYDNDLFKDIGQMHKEGLIDDAIKDSLDIVRLTGNDVKCQRLFRPQFSKVKTSFVSQIRQESDTLTPSEDVSDDTLV